jgi:Protein tyrosine and serine/threonine kinase
LNEKSDVYSFGVILLEIVTGQPPISNDGESIDIVKLVKQKLAKGKLEEVIDSRFKGEYDMNSVWKVVELAMMCTNEESINRPTMADVVMQLKNSVQIEEYCQKGKLQSSDKSDKNNSNVSTNLSISWSPPPTSR